MFSTAHYYLQTRVFVNLLPNQKGLRAVDYFLLSWKLL